jgi:hypothetical protein
VRFVSAFVVALACVLLVSVGCSSPDDVINTPPVADGACNDSSGNRFVDCGNGTVTDTQTQLIWLKKANCLLPQQWDAAMASAAGLKDGDCGLTDNSSAGNWRLPTLQCPTGYSCTMSTPPTGEFETIFASSCWAPYILNTAGTGCWTEGNPFSGVQGDLYWSSTTTANGPGEAWIVGLDRGFVFSDPKDNVRYVWPVRGGS